MNSAWNNIAQEKSIWSFSIGSSCCANEWKQTLSCKYDVERLGVLEQVDPTRADLLIIQGMITKNLLKDAVTIYEKMPFPKYVLAIGACACGGGLFSSQNGSKNNIGPLDQFIPIDFYIPGCPPRPEAIMEGLLKLQEKIRGTRSN
jgi:NADH-quinone oxidoreductase subunit B